MEFQFRINGVSKVGADGLAFWYTSQKPNSTGPLFGNEQLFDGLGIIIDTYDNDGKGVHPYTFGLMAIIFNLCLLITFSRMMEHTFMMKMSTIIRLDSIFLATYLFSNQ